jgi:hypothetical protein
MAIWREEDIGRERVGKREEHRRFAQQVHVKQQPPAPESLFVSGEPGHVVFTIAEIHTITDGTGRFASAQGSFTVHRTHVAVPGADETRVTSGWYEGTITLHSASH